MRLKTKTLNAAKELARLLEPAWPTISAGIARSGAPTMHVAEAPLRDRLRAIEAELSQAREEHALLRREADRAKAAFAAAGTSDPTSAPFKAAQAAVDSVEESRQKIEGLQEAQNGTLRMLGRDGGSRGGDGPNGPRSGEGIGDGWTTAARELGIGEGRRQHIDIPARALLRPAVPTASTTFTPESPFAPTKLVPGVTEAPVDRRFIYPFLMRGEELEPGDLSVSDWTQTSRAIAGEGKVERSPADVTPKAEINLGVDLATPTVKQMAAITKAPNQLLESIELFADFLRAELQYQLDKGLDTHVLAAITAAKVPSGKTGADLIARVRNAKATMLTSGANPALVVLTPTQAAELDLVKTELGYLFGLRPGGATELWGLKVIESPTVTVPTLIDPLTLGRLYLEMGTLLLDPFSHADTNESRVRAEFNALYHCRYPVGAYEVK
jgi:hypothetical protein